MSAEPLADKLELPDDELLLDELLDDDDPLELPQLNTGTAAIVAAVQSHGAPRSDTRFAGPKKFGPSQLHSLSGIAQTIVYVIGGWMLESASFITSTQYPIGYGLVHSPVVGSSVP